MISMLHLLEGQEFTGEREIKEKGRWSNRELIVLAKEQNTLRTIILIICTNTVKFFANSPSLATFPISNRVLVQPSRG